MGNDGGSIPTRRELVREAARPPSTTQVKEAQREQLEHYWTTCPLSHKHLSRPIVSDSVGNLYNKDAILKFLLPGDDDEGISSKADCEEILQGRVKGLRDVVELKFEIDNEDVQQDGGQSTSGKVGERWICPITAKALGPNVKSVYIVPCGHVFSDEVIREMKGDKCLQCNESYTEDNVITILPIKEADKQRLITRGQKLAEQGLTHSLKKAPGSKKRKKHATANGESAAGTSSTPSTSQLPPGNTGIKNAATAMLTARVLEEENEKKKRQKITGRNENIQSLFHNSKDMVKSKDSDFMTRGFNIPATARR